MAIIFSLVPVFFNAYGHVDNNNMYYQCWINKRNVALMVDIPQILGLSVALVLVVYTVYLRIWSFIPSLTTKLVYFPIVFVGIWLIIISSRIHAFINHNEMPIGLLWCHHIACASIGLSDAIVWGAMDIGNSSDLDSDVNASLYQTETDQESQAVN